MAVCVGCLGGRRCWVCLGRGDLLQRNGREIPCHRCAGTGVCPLCRPADAPETRAG